ncbi:MAG: polysaccharide deacetylase family protein [Acidobacteria bacterium]|nr:polysaccharide deacetylase family protein [Acidobacteriota bacterium]
MRSIAGNSFRTAGGVAIFRRLTRGSLRILMYHRFGSRAGLERQCAHIRAHYLPVSLSRVAEAMHGGAPLPDHAMAVTVDDGYRDFYDVAFPVFASYGIPAAVFVVTRFLDGGYWLWGDRVKYAFRNSPLSRVRIELPSGDELGFLLADAPARDHAATQLKERAKLLPWRDCMSIVDSLPSALRVDLPPRPEGEFAPMDWEQARRAAAGGMEVGAHTATHTILSSLPNGEMLDSEIAGSRARIEACLDRPVLHFCYPNGRLRDISGVLDRVRVAGFATAVTAEPGLNFPGADPFLLRRIGVVTSYPDLYFNQRAAAFHL